MKAVHYVVGMSWQGRVTRVTLLAGLGRVGLLGSPCWQVLAGSGY